MRRSTQLLSAALLACVLISTWLWITLVSERANNAELSAQIERLKIGYDSTDSGDSRGSVAAPSPNQSNGVSAPANETADVAAADVDKPAVPDGLEYVARERQLMRDPRYVAAKREQMRLSLASQRTHLIRSLGFTPQQADSTIELTIDDRMWQDGVPIGDTTPESHDAARARYDAFQQEQQGKLRALLGEEKRMQLEKFVESRPTRLQVESLRSRLNDADPLRDYQIEPLIAALHVEQSQLNSELEKYREDHQQDGDTDEGYRLYSERSSQLTKAAYARMITSASSILSKTQLKALEQQLQENLAWHDAGQRVHRLWRNADEGDRTEGPSN